MAPLFIAALPGLSCASTNDEHSEAFHPYVKKKEFLWQNRRTRKLTGAQKLKTSMSTITKINSLNSGF